MSQPYKKRITVKQLAELLLKQSPEVQDKEIDWADFSWEYPEDVRVIASELPNMVHLVGG
jgi:hypothetical protein